jgi:internalin A
MTEKVSIFIYCLLFAMSTGCGIDALSPGGSGLDGKNRDESVSGSDAYPGSPAEFSQWCENSDPAVKLTVDAIRTIVGASTCQDVGAAYEARGNHSLILFAPGVTNLWPLLAFPQLKLVGIQHSSVTDFSPLGFLPALETLVVGADGSNVDLSTLPAVAGLASLTVENFGQVDLSPLSQLKHLSSLYLRTGQLDQVETVSGLISLRVLTLNSVGLGDLLILAPLTGLTTLDIGNNPNLTDLNPLSALSNLTTLRAAGTSVSDLQPLATLHSLGMLDVSVPEGSSASSVDLQPLSGLTKLSALHANNRPVQNLQAVAALPLRYLYLRGGGIDSVSALTSMTSLQYVDVSSNSLSGSVDFGQLKFLRILNLSDCNLTRLPALPTGFALSELYLNDNKIADLSQLAGRGTLKKIYAARNQIISIDPVSGFLNLTDADFSGNNIRNVDGLKNLPALKQLILRNNPLPAGVSCPLDDQSFCIF